MKKMKNKPIQTFRVMIKIKKNLKKMKKKKKKDTYICQKLFSILKVKMNIIQQNMKKSFMIVLV